MGSDNLERLLPPPIETVEQLEDVLSTPSPDVVDAVRRLHGDILILGVAGKMGPTLAKLARRAADAAGVKRKVIGVDLFKDPAQKKPFEAVGIDTVAADLLDPAQLDALPDAKNVVFMVGFKFGSTGAESLVWTVNTFIPGLVARRYAKSRIVVFSSGNIYHLYPVLRGGATETDPVNPVGDYAQSVLGRERMFDHFSRTLGTPVTLFRLNYAIELRFGILLDTAQKVAAGEPVDLTMGNFNCIWQGDANSVVLRSFALADSPAAVLNCTGAETVSVRWLARRFGELLGKQPKFSGEEAPDCFLSNASKCHAMFGYPHVTLEQMVRWVAHWVKIGGVTLGKPTHFETRNGKF